MASPAASDQMPMTDTLQALGRELGHWAASARRIEDDLGANGLTPFVRQETDLLRQHLEQLELYVLALAEDAQGSAAVVPAARSLNLSGLSRRLLGKGDVKPSQECELW